MDFAIGMSAPFPAHITRIAVPDGVKSNYPAATEFDVYVNEIRVGTTTQHVLDLVPLLQHVDRHAKNVWWCKGIHEGRARADDALLTQLRTPEHPEVGIVADRITSLHLRPAELRHELVVNERGEVSAKIYGPGTGPEKGCAVS